MAGAEVPLSSQRNIDSESHPRDCHAHRGTAGSLPPPHYCLAAWLKVTAEKEEAEAKLAKEVAAMNEDRKAAQVGPAHSSNLI